MKVLVLGAGVIGATTAWFLREHGHEVTVVERQSAAALETSYANGGQISVSHVEPWAAPKAPWQILKWLSRPDAPLLFRPTLDPRQWRWGIEFLLECLPSHTRWNMFEHVGIRNYPRYFGKIYSVLKPGGMVMNHGITQNQVGVAALGSGISDFVEEFVFPGGQLAHVSRVIEGLSEIGRAHV